MKRISCVAVALAAALSGCASGKIKQQQAQIEQCEIRAGKLMGQVREAENKFAALEAKNRDLESQVSDLGGKLQAQQERIDSLAKSNQDLKGAIEAKKGELSGKVAEVVQEKDDLARRLDALQKEKIAADRTRSNLKAARDKLAGELGALKAKLDELSAAAQADKEKAQADRSQRLAKTHEDMGLLADAVLKEIQAEKARIEQDGESIVLNLQESLLFKPQQAKLTEEGVALLDRLGRALQALGPRAIRVEGHSDNSAIKWEIFGSFTSHWDLSAARATALSRYLHEHSGLDPRRITASGFGEFRPAKGNDTPEGREANRRVVLVVEPAGTPP